MRDVIACSLLWLSLAACQKGDPAPEKSRSHAPELAASGGKPVPEGFVTTFTAPDAGEVELAYTQAWGALFQGKMALRLSAQAGTLPSRGVDIYLDLSNRKPTRLEALEGAWLTAFPPELDGFLYQPRLGDPTSRRRARSAAVSITSVTADAIEGTFTADFGDDSIPDGEFRAARSPNLEPASLAAMAQRSK
jgi:hypothetical protein